MGKFEMLGKAGGEGLGGLMGKGADKSILIGQKLKQLAMQNPKLASALAGMGVGAGAVGMAGDEDEDEGEEMTPEEIEMLKRRAYME